MNVPIYDLSPCHIAIADDHDAIRSVLERYLQFLYPRATITCVVNASDAWHILTTQHVDLLIAQADLAMMEEVNLVTNLRERGSSMPIVLLAENREQGEAGIAVGANAWLPVHFRMDAFEAVLAAVLSGEPCELGATRSTMAAEQSHDSVQPVNRPIAL